MYWNDVSVSMDSAFKTKEYSCLLQIQISSIFPIKTRNQKIETVPRDDFTFFQLIALPAEPQLPKVLRTQVFLALLVLWSLVLLAVSLL